MAAPTVKQRATTLKRQGFDDGVIGAILGVSADDVRALMYEASPSVDLGGSIKTASVTLDDEQIKALPDVPVVIVPAPAADVGLVPVTAVVVFKPKEDVGQYGNTDDAATLVLSRFSALGNGIDSSGTNAADLLGQDTASVVQMSPLQSVAGGQTVVGAVDDLPDVQIDISLQNGFSGVLTDGHPENTLTVHVAYIEIAV